MARTKLDIYVYADWQGMPMPKRMGVLTTQLAKGKRAFSFAYDSGWLKTEEQRLIDPDIQFFSGVQFPQKKENFGIFLDSMPDTWGRTLMKRKAAQKARELNERVPVLYDIDYLLGVFDGSRMGALRFKTDPGGPFLDDDNTSPTPPWSSVRELQYAASQLELAKDNEKLDKWLTILMAPGSSLGGARPKANILDDKKELWIAKFPSKNDTFDKGAWVYLAYLLAIESGVNMASCSIEKIAGKYHTFFTKRFDRSSGDRIHFASAMTMTGNNEDTIKDNPASYLDIADFIQNYGIDVDANLAQLWRRIVFNIAISNTDDHLRNHGLVLMDKGWILSPAYDLNPSVDKEGLAINIDMDSNELDFDLARSVGPFFRLNESEMELIIQQVINSVGQWKKLAKRIGISRSEQEMMSGAFRV